MRRSTRSPPRSRSSCRRRERRASGIRCPVGHGEAGGSGRRGAGARGRGRGGGAQGRWGGAGGAGGGGGGGVVSAGGGAGGGARGLEFFSPARSPLAPATIRAPT